MKSRTRPAASPAHPVRGEQDGPERLPGRPVVVALGEQRQTAAGTGCHDGFPAARPIAQAAVGPAAEPAAAADGESGHHVVEREAEAEDADGRTGRDAVKAHLGGRVTAGPAQPGTVDGEGQQVAFRAVGGRGRCVTGRQDDPVRVEAAPPRRVRR